MKLLRGCVSFAILLTLTAACGLATPGSVKPIIQPSTVASTQTSKVVSISSGAYKLAYDAPRKLLWFAEISRSGDDFLWSVGVDSGRISKYPLPSVEYNGYTTQIKVSPDGAVWVSLPYELARLDPADGTVRSLEISEKAAGALPAATDRSAPLPGTWISDILFDGNAALVARVNVPYLTRVDAMLGQSQDLPLPDSHAGSKGMVRATDGWAYLLPGWDRAGSILALSPDGSLTPIGGLDGTRLSTHGADVTVLMETTMVATLRSGKATPADVGYGRRPNWIQATDSGFRVEYDEQSGVLTREIPGRPIEELRLDTAAGLAVGGKGGDVTQVERLTDFVLTEDGTVWLMRDEGRVLAEWSV